ncbi:MAG: ABC transporter ATP-binding protein [Propionibacteriaceae bacterium]|nr:ABC transporter ATP-binding protein [Propionibacteriaceae bacterium]
MSTHPNKPRPANLPRIEVDPDHFLKVDHLVKRYGDHLALDEVSLSMPKGSFLVLLGPSGCGKTTTMRSIVGLEHPDSGVITVGGRVLMDNTTFVPVHKRGIGMVFQSYAVWPHKTVAQNVGYPLKLQKVPKAEITKRVEETLELVGLGGLGAKSASKLSGGQMQRVALARSVVMQPDLLLLDEPLSNLDAQLRDKLRLELKRLQQELDVTSVYVTHDQGEALAMADKVAVMFDGRVHQFCSPQELYEAPASLQVAAFIGKSNFLEGAASPEGNGLTALSLNRGEQVLHSATGFNGSGTAMGRVRVEDIHVSREATGVTNEFRGVVKVATYQGSQIGYLIQAPSGRLLEALAPSSAGYFERGEEIHFSFEPEALRLYEATPEDLADVRELMAEAEGEVA